MPAKSKQQQKFFGVVRSMQKGDTPKKGEAGEVADDMKKTDVKDMASTKHKGLPRKVKKESISIYRLKEMVKEEFNNIMSEAKMTPGKVQKVQRDLVKTIDALKKNFPMYKAAKESGDEKKLAKHRDIALKLTKKKKDLELQMDKALGGLYQDAELQLEASYDELQFVNKIGKDVTKHLIDYLTGKIDKNVFTKLSGLNLGFKNQVKLSEGKLNETAGSFDRDVSNFLKTFRLTKIQNPFLYEVLERRYGIEKNIIERVQDMYDWAGEWDQMNNGDKMAYAQEVGVPDNVIKAWWKKMTSSI
jgi:hypothetical protein